jgi:hypothetical protein
MNTKEMTLNKSGSIRNSQIRFTENEFLDTDRESHLLESLYHGDQTSIVSSHFLKAKKLYGLKKIFNRGKLRILFDVFVIKTLQGHKRGYRLLSTSGQTRLLANLMIHKIITARLHAKSRSTFNKVYRFCQERKKASNKLRRAILRKQTKLF